MSLKRKLKPYIPAALLELGKRRSARFEKFAFDASLDPRSDIVQKYGEHGALLDLFTGNEGPVVHKWHHYIPLYERYFAPFRGRPVRVLEIGVSEGGSLQLWRNYFGPAAVIYGIDIDPACARHNGVAGQVRTGSQLDQGFLDGVVDEMGGIDIVIDDGSHHMEDIPATLQGLFPRLNDGGIYLIEDLHTAYWPESGGGYRSRGNFFRLVMACVDDMHHWYHGRGLQHPKISAHCRGVHIHDSIVVLEKGTPYPPVHSRIG